MEQVLSYARRFVKEEDAVTIVEMVIIVAVVLIAVIPALVSLGETENSKLEQLKDGLGK